MKYAFCKEVIISRSNQIKIRNLSPVRVPNYKAEITYGGNM